MNEESQLFMLSALSFLIGGIIGFLLAKMNDCV